MDRLHLQPLRKRLILGPWLGLVLAGCGNASPWTNLHARHLAQARQFAVQGQRDANGRCIYNLTWMPSGTMEQDVAIDDVHCRLVAEVGPIVTRFTRGRTHTLHQAQCIPAHAHHATGVSTSQCHKP